MVNLNPPANVWHDTFIRVTWLIHMRDVSSAYANPPSYVNPPTHPPIGRRVGSHMWMSHVTHVHEPCHTYECVMSRIWIRHVTCLTTESCHIRKCSARRTRLSLQLCPTWMSHVTHGLSHVTHGLSHVTHGLSHVTHETSHVTHWIVTWHTNVFSEQDVSQALRHVSPCRQNP